MGEHFEALCIRVPKVYDWVRRQVVLPQIFTKDQFTAQATLAGKEKDNQRAILCRWLGKQHRIIEIGEKTYQKI